MIGYPEEKIQSDIETDVNNLFAGKLDDFIKDKPKTFVDLTDALLATIQEKNEQIKMSKQDLAKAAAEMESKEANANRRKQHNHAPQFVRKLVIANPVASRACCTKIAVRRPGGPPGR